MPFTKFPPMITSYLFIVQYENQQIEFDTVCVQFYANLSHTSQFFYSINEHLNYFLCVFPAIKNNGPPYYKMKIQTMTTPNSVSYFIALSI